MASTSDLGVRGRAAHCEHDGEELLQRRRGLNLRARPCERREACAEVLAAAVEAAREGQHAHALSETCRRAPPSGAPGGTRTTEQQC